MLIVAGHLMVDPTERDTYLRLANRASRLARDAPGCLEFVQAPDPLVPGRIVILERWESEAALLDFREADDPDAPDDNTPTPAILSGDVQRYEIASVGPP